MVVSFAANQLKFKGSAAADCQLKGSVTKGSADPVVTKKYRDHFSLWRRVRVIFAPLSRLFRASFAPLSRLRTPQSSKSAQNRSKIVVYKHGAQSIGILVYHSDISLGRGGHKLKYSQNLFQF